MSRLLLYDRRAIHRPTGVEPAAAKIPPVFHSGPPDATALAAIKVGNAGGNRRFNERRSRKRHH
jgi:hypothetical protein